MRYLLLIGADEDVAEKAMASRRVRRVRTPGWPTWSAAACWRRTRACTRAAPRRPSGCAATRCCSPTARSSRRKEQIGGFALVDCRDLDEAIEIAAGHPAAAIGQVEIRPVLRLDGRRRRRARSPRRSGSDWGRVVAALIGMTGDWDLAEECAQEAFAAALSTWRRDGVPDRPARLADHHRPQPRDRPDPARPGRRGQAARARRRPARRSATRSTWTRWTAGSPTTGCG